MDNGDAVEKGLRENFEATVANPFVPADVFGRLRRRAARAYEGRMHAAAGQRITPRARQPLRLSCQSNGVLIITVCLNRHSPSLCRQRELRLWQLLANMHAAEAGDQPLAASSAEEEKKQQQKEDETAKHNPGNRS